MFIKTGKEIKVSKLLSKSRELGYQYLDSGLNEEGTIGFYHLQNKNKNRFLKINWKNKKYQIEFRRTI
jgi:hypothetical protein